MKTPRDSEDLLRRVNELRQRSERILSNRDGSVKPEFIPKLKAAEDPFELAIDAEIAPTQFQLEIEAIRDEGRGLIEDTMDMVEVDVDPIDWPLQKEVEALFAELELLDNNARETLRNNVKTHQPELWAAVEMHLKISEALFLAKMEAERKQRKQRVMEYEKIHDILDEALDRVTDKENEKLNELLKQADSVKK